MQSTALHDHVTGATDRLLQLDRPFLRVWVVSLRRRDEHHGARQEDVVIGSAGPSGAGFLARCQQSNATPDGLGGPDDPTCASADSAVNSPWGLFRPAGSR